MGMGPKQIAGKWHVCVVLKVTKRAEDGRPRECEILYPSESTNVQGGEEFVTCFIPETVARKKHN